MIKKSIAFLLLFLSLQLPAFAAVPNTLSYQGTLTDKSGNTITATKTIDFKLYDVATGGTALWSETQTVTVSNGRFGVVLGVVTPFDKSILTGDTWIGITVQGETEMTPRQKLTSVAYAFIAGQVADQSITAASIGEPCATGQVLVKKASGWACGDGTPTLFKPQSFTASSTWQYKITTTATSTTVLTSGNYTVPDGVYYVTIEAFGGSGGGAGGSTYWGTPGGGGGAGEYAGTYLAVTPGSTINIAYGAAGAAGIAGYNYSSPSICNGGNGGDTVVTYNSIEYLRAHGGQGGYFVVGNSTGFGGAGGSGSTDLQHQNGAAGANNNGAMTGGNGGSGPHLPNLLTNIGGNGGGSATNGNAGNAGAVAISYVIP